jgi:hypothetical protein
MPFELGIAVALSRFERNHGFVMLEAQRYRLTKTLSDVNGIDPGIHGGTAKGVISCVLSNLGRPRGNPPPELVARIYRRLLKAVPFLKRNYGQAAIYSRALFGALVEGAARLAEREGLVAR